MRAEGRKNMAVRELSSSDCAASPNPRGKAPHDGHAEPAVGTASLGSSFRSPAPERVTVKNTWSRASVATRFLFEGAQSKARQPRGSPAKFTSRGAAVRPFVLLAAPAIVSPTLAPEGLGGAPFTEPAELEHGHRTVPLRALRRRGRGRSRGPSWYGADSSSRRCGAGNS